MQEKLPVTFRINSGEVGFEKVCSMLKEKDFIENYCKRAEEASKSSEETKHQHDTAFNMAQQNHGADGGLRHA